MLCACVCVWVYVIWARACLRLYWIECGRVIIGPAMPIPNAWIKTISHIACERCDVFGKKTRFWLILFIIICQCQFIFVGSFILNWWTKRDSPTAISAHMQETTTAARRWMNRTNGWLFFRSLVHSHVRQCFSTYKWSKIVYVISMRLCECMVAKWVSNTAS